MKNKSENNFNLNVILVLVVFLVSLGAQSQTPEQSILDLSKKKFEWMIRMQYDSLGAVLDERLMFVHSNGWAETKSELIQDIKSARLRYTSIDVKESSARMYPETAIVTGKGKFNVILDGNALEINLFYTEVYVLKNGKWLLASRHSNRLP